jgi:hypothetical protein
MTETSAVIVLITLFVAIVASYLLGYRSGRGGR